MPQAMAGAEVEGTMRVAVSKNDIWRGKDRQIRRRPLSLGLPPLRQDKCQGRGKHKKMVTNVSGASQRLSSHATCNCTKDQLGLSTWLPTGAQGKDRADLALSSHGLLQAKSLLTSGNAFTFAFPRGLCSGLPADTTLHHSTPQARQHLLSPASSWKTASARPGAAPHSGVLAGPLQSLTAPTSAAPSLRSVLPGLWPLAGLCSPAPQALGRATGAYRAVS